MSLLILFNNIKDRFCYDHKHSKFIFERRFDVFRNYIIRGD